MTARPDVARITVGVQTDGATVREVQQKNTERMTAVINAVKTMGVAEKDIQTSQFSSRRSEWKDGRSRVIGYQVVQQATVRSVISTRRAISSQKLATQAPEYGVRSDFVIDEPMKLREEARAKGDRRCSGQAGQRVGPRRRSRPGGEFLGSIGRHAVSDADAL